MTRLFNDPAAFAAQALEGFAAAHRNLIQQVSGGVVRAAPISDGNVAVIVGGGSGHYPAFAGLVGRGLAAGAAIGNVFASPSARQICDVARAAERGGGVLMSYGNYAGDVLNFDAAAQELRADGIAVAQVPVTDDVASAKPAEGEKRRGVAGDLIVFKTAGAAAERGHSLAEVEHVTRHANALTRSFGVAFAGCTLPGATNPMFTVADNRMSLGLGVHGEPGIGEQELPSADGLAELLVDRLLGEVPDGIALTAHPRVVAVLNGLGSVKYDELFVVYRRVDEILSDRGLQVVSPEVGELVTSFDMAGVSLTLAWLTEDLMDLWDDPAEAAGYRKGTLPAAQPAGHAQRTTFTAAAPKIPIADPASQRTAKRIATALDAVADSMARAADELGRIDAVAGDGDHGIGMARGSAAAARAAREAVAAGAGAATTARLAGDAWADVGGGTSGALWGVALRAFGQPLGDNEQSDARAIAAAMRAACSAVMEVGKAALGDKTMVDTLAPFAGALNTAVSSGLDLRTSWQSACEVAGSAAAATAQLRPRIGRARPLAERSVGTPDPGAVSMARALDAAAAAFVEPAATGEPR